MPIQFAVKTKIGQNRNVVQSDPMDYAKAVAYLEETRTHYPHSGAQLVTIRRA